MALNVLQSGEVLNLVNILRKFSSRPDINELINFIEEKTKARNGWR